MMDGKTIPVNEKFSLVGRDGIVYKVDGPHDPLLPAGEVINCRCMLIPVVKRYEREFPRVTPVRVLIPDQTQVA
jgi:uncharacterized protein with gpF-like domain